MWQWGFGSGGGDSDGGSWDSGDGTEDSGVGSGKGGGETDSTIGGGETDSTVGDDNADVWPDHVIVAQCRFLTKVTYPWEDENQDPTFRIDDYEFAAEYSDEGGVGNFRITDIR